MKKLLLISSMFLACLSSNAQGVWLSQATGFADVSSGIRNISVVDTNIVWVTPYDGNPNTGGLPRQDYSRTVDGGNLWVADTVPTSAIWDWAMLDALDDSTAWGILFNTAVAPVGLGQIWHTENAGATWTQQGAGSVYSTTGESFPNIIHFWNDSVGVVCGDPANGRYEIYTTTNGGTTWDSVPSANIPPPLNATEAGWTTHIDTKGDTIWFDTNFGRVYRSVDRGHNWTVSNTNLINFRGSIDLCFYGDSSGIARYYNDTTTSNIAVETSDGGNTWTSIPAITGSFFGADVKSVPGTDSMLVSTGVSSTSLFTGSSYSLNGGHSWTTIESGTQRNALGIADSLTMWCGGFTTTPLSDGIFKWIVINPVACSDTNISFGVSSASDTAICGGDTVFLTTTGVYAPVNGDFSGVAWVVSSTDISGSNTPTASAVGSFRFVFPAPSTHVRFFINDGTFVDGTALPYGVYYFTPVVFANATAAITPTLTLFDLTMDPNCTFTGTSVAVNIIDTNICSITGIKEINVKQLSVSSSLKDRNTLDVLINSTNSGKASIQIMDVTGRIVNNVNTIVITGSNHESINVENLSAGTYIIKAEVNGNRATNKIVKY